MSQHDLVIDNGPGAAVRTDLVAALQALVSMSSGPIEPVTKYAGMFWNDTSITPNGAIRMRNLANTAWTFPSLYGDDRIGEIAMFAFGTPPTGWLKANGAAISRNTYQALFLKIGTQFGIGDGTSTFQLPDLRGYFLRAWDDGRGIDPTRAFGSIQTDVVSNHTHTASTTVDAGGSHSHGGTADSQGSHTHTGATDNEAAHTHSTGLAFSGAGATGSGGGGVGFTSVTGGGGAHSHGLTINAGGAHTHNITTDTAAAHAHTATTTVGTGGGGTETRPKNISLLACIRYA